MIVSIVLNMFSKHTRRLFISVVTILGIVFVVTQTRYLQESFCLTKLRQLNYEDEPYLAINVRTGKQDDNKRLIEDALTQRISDGIDSEEKIRNNGRIYKEGLTSRVTDSNYYDHPMLTENILRGRITTSHRHSRETLNSKSLDSNGNLSLELEAKAPVDLLEKRFHVRNQSRFSRPHSLENKRSYKFRDEHRVAMRDFERFQEDWCRVRTARLNWKQYLAPCRNSTVWGVGMSALRGADMLPTDAVKSYINHFELKPAGEFSRFFIQTVTNDGRLKRVGGDSWRVHFREGPSSFALTVFDLDNGTYEVLFLVMEPGLYKADIILDYTLCNGFKDPPPDWFIRGNSQGKNQPDGILRGDKPYLLAPLRGGEQVAFEIAPSMNQSPEYFVRELEGRASRAPGDLGKTFARKTRCKVNCPSLLWDGFGRWTNRTWKPFSDDRPPYRKLKTKQSGVLWIFGDSLANNFISALSSGPYRQLCTHVFTSCRVVYNWVYNMRGYWGDGITRPREPRPDGRDYDHERVLRDVKEVLFHPEMDEDSVLFLNWGLHFAAAVNFTNYQRLIDDFIKIILHGQYDLNTGNTRRFKGHFIWKTTTALNRDRFPNPHKDVRRFLTFPRVTLYNAYATYAMCRAGLPVLDVYPISDSYPDGTVSHDDPVHYGSHVFRAVENLLYNMFSSGHI